MRNYGRVSTAFWQDEKVQQFSLRGKLLALYLLTGQHSNGIGCYRLPRGYLCEDLGWNADEAQATLDELIRFAFVVRCEHTALTLIPNYLRFNPIENPKVGLAMLKLVDTLPQKSPVFGRLIECLKLNSKHLPEGFEKRYQIRSAPAADTVSKTVSDTVSETVRAGYGKQEPNLTYPNLTEQEQEPAAPPPLATTHPNTGGERDWITVLEDACRAAGKPTTDAANEFATATAWATAGYAPETILKAIREVAGRPGYAPKPLAYFAKRIAELHAFNQVAPPATAEDAKAQRRAKKLADWRKTMTSWDRHGRKPYLWPESLGPLPGEPRCECPPEVLAEFGIGPLAPPTGEAAA